MANEENLIPFNERTESEQRQIAQKGGIASGAARRRKRSMKEAADYYLSLPETDRRRVNALLRDEVDNEDIDNQMSVVMGITEAAKRGDARAAGVLLKMLGEETVQEDPAAAVQKSYDSGVTDEFMEPVVCAKGAQVRDNDSIIFYNFRPDRAREITRCFVDEDFQDVERKKGFVPVDFVCTTEYDATMPNVTVAYPRQKLENIFGEYISKLGLTQLRIAETEKYAHVTFFFNGGVETVFPGEDRVLIASPKVATYDLQPEMSAYQVTEEAVKRIESGAYDVIILNFANCDMVGHTGVYEAACRAVTAVDECVGRVVEATSRMGGVSLITADHGNAERMADEDGEPFTAHTTNLVPFYIVGASVRLRDGRLADIAPTMLDLMGLEKPAEMDGQTLIVN